ncbi:MAG: intradiol ring-cleavage dioxygenase [Betaproteobacteria bacterium]|nr:intradiol ring-cleavage dioxygenase [Betaproteobacteria bacterium]
MNVNRRRFLVAGAIFVVPDALHAQLCRVTPRDALGPFYIKGAPSQPELCASGSGGTQKLAVSGRVLGMPDCTPLAGALVEVWQADARGDYTQVGARQDDPGCLLRASLKTGADGRYTFRTVMPGEYPGRPRHIHYRVSAKGYATLVTQLYFARERGIPQELVTSATAKEGALAASFDVTLAKA